MDFKIVSIGSVLFVIWIFYSRANNSATLNAPFERPVEVMAQNRTPKPELKPEERRTNLNIPLRGKQLQISKTALSEVTQTILTESARAKKEFEDISYMKFNDKFKEFEYSYLGEIDDNVVMLAGLDSKNNTRLKIAAAPINPTMNQIVDYLKENQSNMFQDLSLNGIENLKPYRTFENQNNFKSVQIMSSVDQDGNLALVALASRKDGKGSYMTVLTGPKDYVWENEGKFEQLFSSFSAKEYFDPKNSSPDRR